MELQKTTVIGKKTKTEYTVSIFELTGETFPFRLVNEFTYDGKEVVNGRYKSKKLASVEKEFASCVAHLQKNG